MADFSFSDYFDAWSSLDGARVAAFMAEDVFYEDTTMGEIFNGPDAVAGFVAATAAWSEDIAFDLVGSFVTPDGHYAGEWVMHGTNTGPFAGIPATGKPFRIRASSVGRLSDGLIAENHDYWNAADYLIQVGILPSPETLAG